MSGKAIHVALVNYGDKKLTKELEFSAERSDRGTEKIKMIRREMVMIDDDDNNNNNNNFK